MAIEMPLVMNFPPDIDTLSNAQPLPGVLRPTLVAYFMYLQVKEAISLRSGSGPILTVELSVPRRVMRHLIRAIRDLVVKTHTGLRLLLLHVTHHAAPCRIHES